MLLITKYKDMMNKFYFALLFIWCSCHAHSQEVLRSSTGAWEVDIARNGAIKTLKVDFGGDSIVSVPWHSSGEYAGPSFSGVSLRKAGKYTYRSRDVYPVAHTLSYSEVDGMLTVQVTLKTTAALCMRQGRSRRSNLASTVSWPTPKSISLCSSQRCCAVSLPISGAILKPPTVMCWPWRRQMPWHRGIWAISAMATA